MAGWRLSCRDFNARIGSGVIDARVDLNAQIAAYAHFLGRSAKDVVVNKSGLKFLEFLTLTKFRGTYFDVSGGTFTVELAQSLLP